MSVTDPLASDALTFGDVTSFGPPSCTAGRMVAALAAGTLLAAPLGALAMVVVWRAVVERRWST